MVLKYSIQANLKPNIFISQQPTCWNCRCILLYWAIHGFGYKNFYSINKCIFGNKYFHWIYKFLQVFELKNKHKMIFALPPSLILVSDYTKEVNNFCLIAMTVFIFFLRNMWQWQERNTELEGRKHIRETSWRQEVFRPLSWEGLVPMQRANAQRVVTFGS